MMNPSSRKRWQPASCLLVVGTLTLHAETVQLQYSPSTEQAYGILDRVTQVTTESGKSPVTDVRERKSVVTVEASETGYENSVTVASQTLTRNGNLIVSPVYAAMPGLQLTYKLDSNGGLLEISGYDQLNTALSVKLPERLAETLSKLMASDSLQSKDHENYNEVQGPYAGATVELAVDQLSAAAHALPIAGSVPLYAVTTTSRGEDEATIQVSRTYNSDISALAEQFESVTAESLTALTGALTADLPENYASASVSGTEQVLVDIGGRLVTRRTISLEYSFTLKPVAEQDPATEQDPVPLVMTITKEFHTEPVSVDAPASD